MGLGTAFLGTLTNLFNELGLTALAKQSPSSVSITGGSITSLSSLSATGTASFASASFSGSISVGGNITGPSASSAYTISADPGYATSYLQLWGPSSANAGLTVLQGTSVHIIGATNISGGVTMPASTIVSAGAGYNGTGGINTQSLRLTGANGQNGLQWYNSGAGQDQKYTELYTDNTGQLSCRFVNDGYTFGPPVFTVTRGANAAIGAVNWYGTSFTINSNTAVTGTATIAGNTTIGSTTTNSTGAQLQISAPAYPKLSWYASGNGANLKTWQSYVNPTGGWNLDVVNDAGNVASNAISITSSSSTTQPTSITLNAPTTIAGALKLGSTLTGSGSARNFGAFTVGGTTGGWGGIDFSAAATLMVSGDTVGFYNTAQTGWNWYWTGSTLAVGTVPAANVGAGTLTGAFAFQSPITLGGTTTVSAGFGVSVGWYHDSSNLALRTPVSGGTVYLQGPGGSGAANLYVSGSTTLVGQSQAPTVAITDNSANIATTAMVQGAIAANVPAPIVVDFSATPAATAVFAIPAGSHIVQINGVGLSSTDIIGIQFSLDGTNFVTSYDFRDFNTNHTGGTGSGYSNTSYIPIGTGSASSNVVPTDFEGQINPSKSGQYGPSYLGKYSQNDSSYLNLGISSGWLAAANQGRALKFRIMTASGNNITAGIIVVKTIA